MIYRKHIQIDKNIDFPVAKKQNMKNLQKWKFN